jgi:hypothetical protein
MLMAGASLALLLDVANLAAGRDLSIAPDDAATAEGCETKKSNETHAVLFAVAEKRGVVGSLRPATTKGVTGVSASDVPPTAAPLPIRHRMFLQGLTRTENQASSSNDTGRPAIWIASFGALNLNPRDNFPT